MKQAKVLTDTELKRVLAVVSAGRHAARNRIALMLSPQNEYSAVTIEHQKVDVNHSSY